MNMITADSRRRSLDTSPVPITAANDTPVLAPPRRRRYEYSICALRAAPSIHDCKQQLNDLGTHGWTIAGIDDGFAYLQRETCG